ncbi:ABC transporter ATP-binding protein [Paenibacillus camelliae]|uniref:ABC transporter ATP-binding protein n=1 Tax=Paenibacillus camelliae TaxID=512410 RepID=UPI002040B70F|nr:ABC transporter ATP-binding protein [Paenibacillus camelliae]MCM3634899.1 ABC transporter ATP-binding protein [Paenibacillus camelliae]
MIKFKAINKTYNDGHQVLKNLNLTINQGEITVLIGPSGCGKTTTMKLINRLITPSSGEILLQDENIANLDPIKLRRKIGYVIQNIGLFPHMTIAQNVAVVPRLLKWDKKEINAKVDELLNLVGLDPNIYRDRYPSELSGGQQQRVGVIRALAANPVLILMDEPFSALDPISREQLQDELVRLQQEIKTTIVFVTHDMDEAIKIADTIVIMKDGEIVQAGAPEQILRHPANDFVKHFIGSKRMQSVQAMQEPTVDDVMADQPAVIYPSRGLAYAVKLMESRKVDSLFVIDKNNKLLGSVSIYQILDQYKDETKLVADVMKPAPHVVLSGTSLSAALNLMNEHQLSNMPIVKQEHQFVGLITRGSVISHMTELYTSEHIGGEIHAVH